MRTISILTTFTSSADSSIFKMKSTSTIRVTRKNKSRLTEMTLKTIRKMLQWPKIITISSRKRMFLQRRLNNKSQQQMMVTKLNNKMQQPQEKANLLKKRKKNKRQRIIMRSRKRSRLERKKRKKIYLTYYPKAGLKVHRLPRLAIRSAFREPKRESNRRA